MMLRRRKLVVVAAVVIFSSTVPAVEAFSAVRTISAATTTTPRLTSSSRAAAIATNGENNNAAVASPRPPSSKTSTPTRTLSHNQKALESLPPFPRTWVPLASVFELDPSRPTPLHFLGQRYVTYRAGSNDDDRWVVMDDACPHRLAPLSEGRIDATSAEATGGRPLLECAYHGWAFDERGSCRRIPQVTQERFDKLTTATNNKNNINGNNNNNKKKCNVKSYPVVVLKNVLWMWPWADDCLSILNNTAAHPPAFMDGIVDGFKTYTRDLPYGWDTLLENLVDSSHVPWAHHGMQGSRDDSIPINMTTPSAGDDDDGITLGGFSFGFQDRTKGLLRSGVGEFRAPYVLQYNAKYTETNQDFNLSSICIPTRPGWSRVIVFAGYSSDDDKKEDEEEEETAQTLTTTTTSVPAEVVEKKQKKKKKKQKKSSSFSPFALIPTWLSHLLSNRFLDSDLAFLHYQEQERVARGIDTVEGYYMPAAADRCVSALRTWVTTFAHVPGPIPPAIHNREVLFDRWNQHTAHCRHCGAAYDKLKLYRKRNFFVMAAGIVLSRYNLLARLVTVGSILFWRLLEWLEPFFRKGDFKHYLNH